MTMIAAPMTPARSPSRLGTVTSIENANRQDEMFLTGIRMARLIVRGEGFDELTEPEVPSKLTAPATTVTKENVAEVKELGL